MFREVRSLTTLLIIQILGGLWYFFAIQRERACWEYGCRENGCGSANFDCNSNTHSFLDPSVTSAKPRQHVKGGDKPRSLNEQLLKFGG